MCRKCTKCAGAATGATPLPRETLHPAASAEGGARRSWQKMPSTQQSAAGGMPTRAWAPHTEPAARKASRKWKCPNAVGSGALGAVLELIEKYRMLLTDLRTANEVPYPQNSRKTPVSSVSKLSAMPFKQLELNHLTRLTISPRRRRIKQGGACVVRHV